MNKVEITVSPIKQSNEPKMGALYESTALNHVIGPGRVYVAAYANAYAKTASDGVLTLFNLHNGVRHDNNSTWGPSGPAGWRRLPPGTVVTITVEED